MSADSQDRVAWKRIEDLLGFEIEGDRDEFLGMALKGLKNKRAIQFLQQKTGRRPLYRRPFHRPYPLPNATGIRIFALGPPRDEELLLSLDPIGSEGYDHHIVAGQSESFFAAALDRVGDAFQAAESISGETAESHQPFARRYRIPEEQALQGPYGEFFAERYGPRSDDAPNDWRRIDKDWLHSAEGLALRLNNEVNNTSLVIAIELPASRRVLLFVGDAQRGNWVSWNRGGWTDQNGLADGEEIDARDLLGRTVLYKVGHHGSHNATMKGTSGSDYPNLAWMARGDHRDDFVAMIPANQPWANDKAHWRHPLPSIKRALVRKARGRVFQTDVDRVGREIRPLE